MSVPQRPDTPPDAALEALERIVLALLVDVAKLKGGEADLLAKREGLLQGFATTPIEGRRKQVADHMDWLISLAELSLRRKGE